MNTDTFWSIIEETRVKGEKDCDKHVAALRTYLLTLPPKDVESFDEHLNRLVGDAYSDRLWNAIDREMPGPSDDGFEYFRRWLVMQGKETYHQVIRRPSSLREILQGYRSYPECEEVGYVADEVIEKQTGVSWHERHKHLWEKEE